MLVCGVVLCCVSAAAGTGEQCEYVLCCYYSTVVTNQQSGPGCTHSNSVESAESDTQDQVSTQSQHQMSKVT